ncbi:MAG: class I SAM-dependent methyltransferase [Gammaproteobacteria bacterium]|nr:class I SAM-dependent methyltransferase [Gammaproteobacteria bacterium]MBU1558966.1 class I SAM-dependent methyltransferase [Gammaproteobacteria bacterium]MBU2546282.1 class I SAM-dependent methyltransferase [Gammaproteobacteria bacterium]
MANVQDFMKEIQQEIHPPITEKIKNHLRTLYGPLRRINQRQLVRKHFHLPAQLKFTDFFIEEGGYRNLDYLSQANHLYRLKNKEILIIGCGYGKHLFTIAEKFQPKKMHCIEPFPHAIWEELKREIETRTNVSTQFYAATMEEAAKLIEPNSIDCCLSDAVLEHVQNMSAFMKAVCDVLKKNGGFYASFGPLWYSPSGDHQNWGSGHEYDHLLLSPTEYREQWEKYRLNHKDENYPTEALCMYENKLFSYLKPQEYADIFTKDFVIDELWIGINSKAITMLNNRNETYLKLAKQYGELPISIKSMFAFMRKL